MKFFCRSNQNRDNAGSSKVSRRRFGGTLLETAIVLPVLVSVGFGMIEVGHYFFVKNAVQGAAREGARAAIVSTGTNSDVTAAVATAMSSAGISSGYTTTTSPASVTAALTTGTSITVTVTIPWSSVGVIPMGYITSSKTLTGTATMRRD